MENEFQSSKPIYLQIADRVYYRLIRSELSPGGQTAVRKGDGRTDESESEYDTKNVQ